MWIQVTIILNQASLMFFFHTLQCLIKLYSSYFLLLSTLLLHYFDVWLQMYYPIQYQNDCVEFVSNIIKYVGINTYIGTYTVDAKTMIK